MSVNQETERRAGPYESDGIQTTFPFTFKIFAPDQVTVVTSLDGLTETVLEKTEYSVTIEANQDTNPGGSVNLHTPLDSGMLLTVLSAVPYTQPLSLTSRGGFYPEAINQAFDRCVILAQQLREQLNRTLVVPATSSQTPQEVLIDVLETANTANEYAQAAKKTYEEVLKTQAEIEEFRDTAVVDVANEGIEQVNLVQNEGTTQVSNVNVAGSTQVTNVTNEGNKQVERLQNIADFEESGSGVRCVEVDWVVRSEIAEGSIITIPNNFIYVAGRNQLRVSVNGLTLLKDENFAEVGEADYESSQIVMKMPLAVGDEVQAWTIPLGRGGTDDLIERIKVLEDSISDLSARVVYRGEE